MSHLLNSECVSAFSSATALTVIYTVYCQLSLILKTGMPLYTVCWWYTDYSGQPVTCKKE